MSIDILRPKGRYSPRDYTVVHSVRGAAIAELALAPGLLVDVIIDELHESAHQPEAEIIGAIERAADLFVSATIGAETAQIYTRNVHHATGLPLCVVERASRDLGTAMRGIRSSIEAQVPAGVGEMCGEACRARTIWIRRGSTLGVIAPSNHPATHSAWLQGLALGYKIMLRPGSRDPFTPYRLAHALLEAGLDPAMLAFVPGDHHTATRVMERCDFKLVFGDSRTVQQLGRDNRTLARGPGYSKVVVGRSSQLTTQQIAHSVVESVAGDAGVKCSNASGCVSERADFAELTQAIAAALARLPIRPLDDPAGRVPVFSRQSASTIRAAVSAFAERSKLSVLGGSADEAIVDFGDGSAALRPSVFVAAELASQLFEFEAPYPALWIARVDDLTAIEHFGRTLVLGYLGADSTLHARLLRDASICKLIHGPSPTHRPQPLLPHEGFMAQTLMTAKASVASGAF